MSKFAVFSLIVLFCAPFAFAGPTNSLTVPSLDNSSQRPTGYYPVYNGPCFLGDHNYCNYGLGMEGSPGSGYLSSDLNAMGKAGLSLSFVTAPALWWSDEGGTGYEASFGYGGTFQMTLANGASFNGVVTGGGAGTGGTLSIIDVTFFGEWNDGQYAKGEAVLQSTPYGLTASLTSQQVPEPPSFALLGTGLVGLWRLRKTFMR